MGTSFVSYTGAPAAPAATDPFFSSVVLLTHFDVDTGIWKDSSSFNHTLTVAGSTTTADTAIKKFGISSFAGARSPSPFGLYCSNTNFKLDNLWTVEFWIYLDPALYTEGVTDQICGVYGGGALFSTIWGVALIYTAGSWYIQVQFSDASGTGVTTYLSSAIPSATYSEWNSIAVTRNGTTTNGLKIFLNGNIIGQRTISYSLRFSSSLNFTLGAYATNAGVPTLGPHGGRMDELRITRGVCRYTGAYAPATQPFPNSG